MVTADQVAECARQILKREIQLRRRVNSLSPFLSSLRPATMLIGRSGPLPTVGVELELPQDSIKNMDIGTLSEMHLEFPMRDLAAKVYRFENFFPPEVPKAVEYAGTVIDLDIGMVLRYVRMFDCTISRFINRFDVLGY